MSDELSGARVWRMRLLHPNWMRSPGLPMSVRPLKSTRSCEASRSISVALRQLAAGDDARDERERVVDLRRIGLEVEALQLVRTRAPA